MDLKAVYPNIVLWFYFILDINKISEVPFETYLNFVTGRMHHEFCQVGDGLFFSNLTLCCSVISVCDTFNVKRGNVKKLLLMTITYCNYMNSHTTSVYKLAVLFFTSYTIALKILHIVQYVELARSDFRQKFLGHYSVTTLWCRQACTKIPKAIMFCTVP